MCAAVEHLLIHKNPIMYMSTVQAIFLLRFRVDPNWPSLGLEGIFPHQISLSGSGTKLRNYTISLRKQYRRGRLQSLSLNLHIQENYQAKRHIIHLYPLTVFVSKSWLWFFSFPVDWMGEHIFGVCLFAWPWNGIQANLTHPTSL